MSGTGFAAHLQNRHVQLIAIGGAIGTGLFMGSRKRSRPVDPRSSSTTPSSEPSSSPSCGFAGRAFPSDSRHDFGPTLGTPNIPGPVFTGWTTGCVVGVVDMVVITELASAFGGPQRLRGSGIVTATAPEPHFQCDDGQGLCETEFYLLEDIIKILALPLKGRVLAGNAFRRG